MSTQRLPPGKKAHSKINPFLFFGSSLVVLTAFISILIYQYSSLSFLIAYVIGINVTTFLLCGYDKGISASRSTRVPEKILFAAALLGGPIGLIAGMKLLRHKTQKSSFQLILVAILVVQVILLRLLLM